MAGTTLPALRRLGWRAATPLLLLSSLLLLLLVWLRRARPLGLTASRSLSAGGATSAKLPASMPQLDAELRRAMDPRWFQGAGERIKDRSPPIALQEAIASAQVRPHACLFCPDPPLSAPD